MSWKIIRFLLWVFIFFYHIPYFFVGFLPTLITLCLFHPPNVFYKLRTKDFLHVIMIYWIWFAKSSY
jgi:hypothetical protein